MATEILRPNGAGFITELTANGAATNWECVDEASHDSNTTYVSNNSSGITKKDLYTINANSIGVSDTINSVTLYIICRCTATGRLIVNTGYRYIRENGVSTVGGSNSLTTSYASYSTTWNTKPSNGSAWTKTDIDNLQIGVQLLVSGATESRCTQVYVVVDYTPSGGGGSVSQKIVMPRQAIKRASNF